MTIKTGLEKFIEEKPSWLEGKQLGLLCNQASTDSLFRHSRDLINAAYPAQLKCLFSPQHGFFSEKQDNMIESDHAVDPVTGLPIYSLYEKKRKPTAAMFDLFDVLVVDLQDVGTRVYTFMYTMAYCLEQAKKSGKKVLVLDRPNPLSGAAVEGNILQDDCSSFVGLYPLPMRHGLTMGELAMMMNTTFNIGAELEIIKLEGWTREMYFDDTGLPWVFPSPNLPTFSSVMVYPGQVVWEGTNISEGRGTTLPFELFGAPFINTADVLKTALKTPLPGCIFRPLVFEPTSNKWQGKPCRGFQIHITDKKTFKPYRTALAFLQAFITLYRSDFQYKKTPYEYEFERLPMDLIIGDTELRLAIEAGEGILDLEAAWQRDLVQYVEASRRSYLY